MGLARGKRATGAGNNVVTSGDGTCGPDIADKKLPASSFEPAGNDMADWSATPVLALLFRPAQSKANQGGSQQQQSTRRRHFNDTDTIEEVTNRTGIGVNRSESQGCCR